LVSVVKGKDAEGQPTYFALVKVGKEYIPISLTPTVIISELPLEKISYAILEKLPDKFVTYLADIPKGSPVFAAWVNYRTLKAYKTAEGLYAASQSYLGGYPGMLPPKSSSAGTLSPMEIEALAEQIPELLEPLKAGQVAQVNVILAKLKERKGRLSPSLARVEDVEGKPTHVAVLRTEKGYLPVSITTGLTKQFKDRQAQYFTVGTEIIAVAVLREPLGEILPYLAIAPAPEETPLWAAWINIPELKQAYKTSQALRVAA
ncbi:unnamed protein product, partial [marine sediment metagenome]